MDKDTSSCDMDRCVNYLMQLRRANLCFQKQCQTPMGEMTVLLSIYQMIRQGLSVSVSSLGDRLQLSRPAVSRMMHTLKKKGYIVLHPGMEDHRYIFIELTRPGQDLLQREAERCLDLLHRVSDRMGKDDMEQYLYYSRKFASILMEEKAKPDKASLAM